MLGLSTVKLFFSFVIIKYSENFYLKWALNLVEWFFCIYWDDHMLIILHFTNVVYDIDCFFYVEVSSLYAYFLEGFYHKCWILSKAFSASIEVIICFLFFNLWIWFITLIDLNILKNPCIPGINPTWSWCMILLICSWILFASILLRIFASIFISDIGL